MTVGDDVPEFREGACTVTGSAFETGVICFDPIEGTLSRLLPGYVNKHTYTAVASNTSNGTNTSSFTERRIAFNPLPARKQYGSPFCVWESASARLSQHVAP